MLVIERPRRLLNPSFPLVAKLTRVGGFLYLLSPFIRINYSDVISFRARRGCVRKGQGQGEAA